MGIGNLGRLLDIGDQIFPGGCKALIGLGFGATFHQGFNHTGCRNLLATSIEDFFLKLGNQGQSLIAELDGELSHGKRQSLSHQ